MNHFNDFILAYCNLCLARYLYTLRYGFDSGDTQPREIPDLFDFFSDSDSVITATRCMNFSASACLESAKNVHGHRAGIIDVHQSWRASFNVKPRRAILTLVPSNI